MTTKAKLAATVYVRDPDTRQTVELAEGTSPEPRLAALVTSKAAWVDGQLPRLPKGSNSQADQDPPGDGPDDASGDTSEASGDGSSQDADKAAPAAKKTAARKTAATKPARGRDADEKGDIGA